jgi:predicted DsbA family dithiol-disulfide isomerase
LEKAIAQLPAGTTVEVRHHAFQLQPDIAETVPTSVHLAEKYRLDASAVRNMQANVCAIADGEGLCYDLDNTLSGNTLDAHRLLLWAATIGKQSELLEAMFSGYFEHAESLFTRDDLIAVASRVGIAADEVNALLDSDAYAQDVIDDQQLASGLGATGVPFFVINRTYGIAGAQPIEVFTSTLARALAESAE